MNEGFKKIEEKKRQAELSKYTQKGLLTHRFRLQPEGRETRGLLRAYFEQEHERYPEFIGIGFKGSQVKGYATKDSDWDLVLLFDEEKKQYSDISDSLTLVNRSIEDFAEKNNIEFGTGYSCNEVGFCIYERHRVSRDMKDLAENIQDKNYRQMADVIISQYQELFLPYMGDIKAIRAIRREVFDELFESCGRNEDLANLVWHSILEHLVGLENYRTVERRESIPKHPRYNLYPRTYLKARQYFLGEK